MAKKRRTFRRLRLGDVIEIPLSGNRFAYAQYAFYYRDPPAWGHLIRVLPGVFSSRPDSFKELVQADEQFSAFFPAGSAVNQRMVEIVASEEIPEGKELLPALFKYCFVNSETGVKTWFLWDGKSNKKIGTELSPDLYDLPMKELVSFGVLVERIEAGWTPRDEV